MRIAVVTETYPPEINGVAMTFGTVVRGLRELGWEVAVFRPWRRDRRSGASAADVDMRGFPLPGYPELRVGWPAPLRLRREWRRRRPELVHVVTEGPLGASAVQAARALGIPVTSSYHTNFHSYTGHYGMGIFGRLALAWLRFLHNRTWRTFAPTRALCGELEALGFRDLAVLSRGVDTVHFHPARRCAAQRRKWGVADDAVVALHVGRVAPEKNFGLLFLAYATMRAAEPRLRLVVVGDGPLRAELERRHPEVHFTGFVSREDLAVHYASADLFLLPSLTETFGNVLTEAMASGLPAVAFDYAAASEFLDHERSGLAAPRHDAPGFIAAAGRLAGDAPLRAQLGPAARAAVEHQSWEHVIRAFAAELKQVAQAPVDPRAAAAAVPGRLESRPLP